MKTYTELCELRTYNERYEYLKLTRAVGEETFGYDRYLNQVLYTSLLWRGIRNRVIIRDNGCDMGLNDYPIPGRIIVHHINPITLKDIDERSPILFDPNNLVCVSHDTHNAIHYGVQEYTREMIERKPNDTIPWR